MAYKIKKDMQAVVQAAIEAAGLDPSEVLLETHAGVGREAAPYQSAAWARGVVMNSAHAFAPVQLQDGTVSHVSLAKTSLIDAINTISPPGKRGEIKDDGNRFDIETVSGSEYGITNGRDIAFAGYNTSGVEIPDLAGLTGGVPLPTRERKDKRKNKNKSK